MGWSMCDQWRLDLWRRGEFSDPTALISLEDFVLVARQSIDLKGIRDSDKLLRIAATNWTTGSLRIFANADMTDQAGDAVIQAAAAFPGLPPVPVDGELYADGGYVLNTPLGPAIRAGADEVHVVFMDPDTKNIPIRQFDNSFDVINNLYQITQAAVFEWDIGVTSGVNATLDFVEQAGLQPSQERGVLEAIGRLVFRTKALPATPLRRVTLSITHARSSAGPLGC